METEPFEMPEEMLIDPKTGFSLNIPLSLQAEPGWTEQNPAAYALFQKAREEAGIVIDDFPDGPLEDDGFVVEPMDVSIARLKRETGRA